MRKSSKSKKSPRYQILGGDFGKEILKEYNHLVKSEYGDTPNLKSPEYSSEENSIIKDPNIYSTVLINQILKKYGVKTANIDNVNNLFRAKESQLQSKSIDLGFIIKPKNNQKFYESKTLVKKIKEKGYSFSNGNSIILHPSDLELISDNKSPSGLNFMVSKEAKQYNLEDYLEGGQTFIKREDYLSVLFAYFSINAGTILGESEFDNKNIKRINSKKINRIILVGY